MTETNTAVPNVINPQDKQLFIKTLNKRGFLLEDKTWKILNDRSYNFLLRNEVISHNDERVEIDFVYHINNVHFVIECKRTDFAWMFPKASQRSDILNVISDAHTGISVKTLNNIPFKTAWFDIAISFKSDGRLDKKNEEVKTSYKEIHEHIKQALKETEAYLSSRRCIDEKIIPVIVTNAKLFYLEYSKVDIDNNGDLRDYTSLSEINELVYNFPEILKWDGGRQTITNHGEHIKSVFVVNVNHLDAFIEEILRLLAS